jgi:serpin B
VASAAVADPGSDDAFGADLYRVLAAGDGGLVFSPASIAAALRLALLGARGATAAELAAVLHLAGPEEAAGGLRLLAAAGAAEAGETGEVTCRAPAGVWLQTGLPVRPEFTGAVAGPGPVVVRDADFAAAPEQARQLINKVIAEQTEGRIADLLGPGSIGAATRLVLASAVYLKAAWAHPFPAGATTPAPFHPAAGPPVTAAMMRLTARLGYLRGDGYQAVVLPYRGGRLAMAVVLPDSPPGLPGLTGRLAAGGLAGLLAGAAPQRVRLGLPRFRLRGRFALRPALQWLGVTAAFGAEADFTGITGAERLAVSEVVHSAFIDTGEQGTEAAAATGVTMVAAAMATGRTVELTVDRPFLFAITDTASGLPLFLGRVTDPS